MTESLIGGPRSLRQIRGKTDRHEVVFCRGRSPFRERGCSDRARTCWTIRPASVKQSPVAKEVGDQPEKGDKTPRQKSRRFSFHGCWRGIISVEVCCCSWPISVGLSANQRRKPWEDFNARSKHFASRSRFGRGLVRRRCRAAGAGAIGQHDFLRQFGR